MNQKNQNFYTSAFRYGKSIKYTGYENGRKVKSSVPFKPVLHVNTPNKGQPIKWHALDGTPVEPIVFNDMSEATTFIKSYKDVPAFKIFGNTNYVIQYLNEEFPGEIAWDRNVINVTSLDIECKSGDGFPEPELADQEITAITTKNNIDDTYHTFGCGEYDVSKSLMQTHSVRYVKCQDEKDLLYKFVSHMEATSPDVITGWNVEFFDIPYLVNRIAKVNSEATMKRLSPWGLVDTRETKSGFGQTVIKYELKGIAILDYMAIFKKFGYTYGPQESYRLDHIANVVLGEKKLDFGEAS